MKNKKLRKILAYLIYVVVYASYVSFLAFICGKPILLALGVVTVGFLVVALVLASLLWASNQFGEEQ